MLSFGKSLGGGFRLRTSNPLIVITLGSMIMLWQVSLICVWLCWKGGYWMLWACWQLFYWPSVWSVRGTRALIRAVRSRQVVTG